MIAGRCLIIGAEVAPNNIVRVIFKKEHKDEVVVILRNIYVTVEETFATDIAKQILDPEQSTWNSKKHERELEYARKLKTKHLRNPHSKEPETPYQPKARIQFGSFAQAANDTNQTTVT